MSDSPTSGPVAAGARVEPSADVDGTSRLGAGTRVWHLAQVREGASIGAECTVGRGAYVGAGVVVGDRCKIQNYALVYEPARLEDGVFVGPAAVLTNDRLPRAVTPQSELKAAADWTPVGVVLRHGASVGARAVCVAPVEVGRWAVVAAGAVVTRDVPDHALVAGVPARRLAWVGRTGARLVPEQDPEHEPEHGPGPGSDSAAAGRRTRTWRCPDTGLRYTEHDGTLQELPA